MSGWSYSDAAIQYGNGASTHYGLRALWWTTRLERTPMNEIIEHDATLAPVRQTSAEPLAAVPPMRVDELIRHALDMKTDPAVLERLVGLYERVKESNAREAFNAALAAFQSECPPIPRNARTQFASASGSGSPGHYADLETIEPIIRPVLARNGLGYHWDTEVGDTCVTAIAVVSHVAGASRQARFTVPHATKSGASEQQKYGSAATYAQRRALIAVLGLGTTDPERPEVLGGKAPDGGELINDEQFNELRELIGRANVAEATMLTHYKIAKLDDLPASQFNGARQRLVAKINAAGVPK